MAGRGRKKQKPSKSSKKALDEQRHQSVEIPSDLLEVIISRLSLRDNIRASLVCKQWDTVATSFHKKPMWLMFIPKSGDTYEFYDPSGRKSYWLEFPELHDSEICHAEHGWLLAYRRSNCCLFFFNPYTCKFISLPELELKANQGAAFSAAPTSSACVVFTVFRADGMMVSVSTCDIKATQWNTVNYKSHQFYNFLYPSKLVVCNGVFYCLDVYGFLGVYDPKNPGWTETLPCDSYRDVHYYMRCYDKFFSECNGEIYVLYTSPYHDPIIYKMDQNRSEMVEVKEFGGMTFFAGCLHSHATVDLAGNMRNAIFFPKVQFYGKRCVTYSLEKGRYYPQNKSHNWTKLDPHESVWIESPKDMSIFL